MNEASFRPDDFGKVREESDDVVFDLRFDRIDARNVELGGLALFPDFFCGILRDDPELRHGVGGVRLDLEPDAKFGFRRPDGDHLGAGIAEYHGRRPDIILTIVIVGLVPAISPGGRRHPNWMSSQARR